jgi:hypothetical protein
VAPPPVEEVAPAPPPVKETPAPVVKPRPKAAKKTAAAKDTTPEPPKLKPIEPKVIHQ